MDDLSDAKLTELQGFLTRLARRLARDESAASDLIQDTWVAALRQPGSARTKSRAWFARVLTNVASNHGRSEGRRRRREEAAAGPEFGSAHNDVVQLFSELELGQATLSAVKELPEPQCAVVLLRYWRGCGVGAIASELGVSKATVKARLARARAVLRQKLDGQYHGRRNWAALASAPFAAQGGGTVVFAIKTLACAGFAAGALVLAQPWHERGRPAAVPVAAVAQLVPEQQGPDAPESDEVAPSATEVQRVSIAQAKASGEPTPTPKAPLVKGRVMDAFGQPLADVPVVFIPAKLPARPSKAQPSPLRSLVRKLDNALGRSGEPRPAAADTRSDQAGRFALETAEPYAFHPEQGGIGRIETTGSEWVTLATTYVVDPYLDGEALVVAAPAVDLLGTVTDADASPVTGAEVRWRCPRDFGSRFETMSERTRLTERRSGTGTAGRFAINGAPALDGAILVVGCDGFVSKEVVLGAADRAPAIVLERPAREHVLRGRVLDPGGLPVAGTRVSLGGAVTTSNEKGDFELDARPEHADHVQWAKRLGHAGTLRAVKAGYRPATFRADRAVASERFDWPAEIILRLGPPPLTLTGRVTDESGAPLADALVWLHEATWFSGDGGGSSVESLLGGSPNLRWPKADVAPDGSFELRGLLQQDYRIVVANRTTLQRIITGPVPAGSRGLNLVLPNDGCWRSITGRVVATEGSPISGVTVSLTSFGSDLLHEGRHVRNTAQLGRETVTHADGSFELLDVPKSGVALNVRGPGIVARGLKPELRSWDVTRTHLEGVRLVVSRKTYVQVVLLDPNEADSFELHSRKGNRLRLHDPSRASYGTRSTLTTAGRSSLIGVDASAASFVLYSNGKEVRRTPLALLPGERNELH